MSNEHNSKKMRFNEENLEECERQIMLQHDRAMGYATRLSPVRNVLHIAMEVFKPPPSIMPIMETFRAWIRRNQLARFDCFEEANWDCPCYKCDTWRKHKVADVVMMQQIQQDQENEFMKNFGMPSSPCKGAQEQNQNVMCSDEGVGLFSVRYACVAHFYVDLPSGDENVPSTPKFSTVEYDLPASDHGKEKAQQRWIALMQMTPTRLVF